MLSYQHSIKPCLMCSQEKLESRISAGRHPLSELLQSRPNVIITALFSQMFCMNFLKGHRKIRVWWCLLALPDWHKAQRYQQMGPAEGRWTMGTPCPAPNHGATKSLHGGSQREFHRPSFNAEIGQLVLFPITLFSSISLKLYMRKAKHKHTRSHLIQD